MVSDPILNSLIDKLSIARNIYPKASSKIQVEPIKDQLTFLASRKVFFLESLIREFDLEKVLGMDQPDSRVELETEQLTIELNHMLLNGSERELLIFCIQREEELIRIYQHLLTPNLPNNFCRALLASQLSETSILL